MTRCRVLAVLLFPIFVSGCGSAPDSDASVSPEASAGEPVPDTPGLRRNLAYGPDYAQTMDVLVGPRPNSPLVVFIHGGAWIGGGRFEFAAESRAFRRMGFAVAAVDYRLSVQPRYGGPPSSTPSIDPVRLHPVHARDVATALGWLSGRSREFSFDPRRVIVVGHSAGAHIAATIATTPEFNRLAGRPTAFVGLEGIYDLPTLLKRWPSYDHWFLNAAFGTDQKKWAFASPTRRPLVSRSPWLVVHMRGDSLVDVPQSDAFSAHLRRAGVSVTDLRPPGGSHGEAVIALSDEKSPITQAILTLVRSLPKR